MRWVDVEKVVAARLTAALAVPADSETPEVLEGKTFLRVMVASGDDDGINDSPTVDVEAFAPSRRGAYLLAEDARLVMLGMAGRDPSGDGRELIDSVSTAVRPRWVDYRNPKVDRVVAAYRVTTRLQ